MPYVDSSALADLRREVQALRTEQAEQFRELHAAVARLQARNASTAESERIAALAAAFPPGREFFAAEVLAAALGNGPGAARLALAFRGCSVQQVGVRLGRLVGRATPDGLSVERTGAAGDCSTWGVTAGAETPERGR